MRSCRVAAASLLFALPAAAHAADPAPVIAAERAFAADGAKNGVQASFLRWSAPQAIIFAPDPVNAQAFYAARPDRAGAVLTWRPTYAGLAQSGDLGFTTGPYAVNGQPGGHYFTVWARQPDGSWKWIYDGGVDDDASTAPPPEAPVAAMLDGEASADAPMDRVRAAEAQLAGRAREDLLSAYRPALSRDARVELAARPKAVDFQALGGGVSRAGDLAWTYGSAAWVKDGVPRRGHYVRIWRNDPIDPGGAAAYRIVFDQLLEVPLKK